MSLLLALMLFIVTPAAVAFDIFVVAKCFFFLPCSLHFLVFFVPSFLSSFLLLPLLARGKDSLSGRSGFVSGAFFVVLLLLLLLSSAVSGSVVAAVFCAVVPHVTVLTLLDQFLSLSPTNNPPGAPRLLSGSFS